MFVAACSDNLAKLVYRDLTNKAYRNQVLQHMRTQAHAVLDTDGDGHISPSEFDQARCKILSDVDGTLPPSLPTNGARWS